MAPKPFFSGRIPQSLYDALEEHRQQTNESKTDILIRALSHYINHPIDPLALPQSSAAETSRIESLEKKFEALEQDLRALKELFLIKPSNSASEHLSPQIVKGEEEITGQILLTLEEDVISPDNKPDNTSDNENESNDKDSAIPDNSSDNGLDNKKGSSPYGVFLGTMKTAEVLELPGLEYEDPKKLKNKVNNTKKTKTQTTQIGPYTIVFSKRPEVPGRQRQELFWDVYKSNPGESVIKTDNSDDN